MDAYDIQQRLKQAWGNIFMQQSRTDNLNKHAGAVPVCVVQDNGTEKTVVGITVKENRIYLELK